MSEPYRIGIWCAVSSTPQADTDKESLPAQEAAGREFARAIGGEVVRVYSVPGHSRDYWNWYEAENEMPAYRQVREDLEAGLIDVVHCLDADRLGRDPALIQQFHSLAERHGCEVYDASMPHTLGQQSLGHRYGTAVKSVAAAEDQRRRIQRHRMGMKGRVKRGLVPGRWPYGYRAIRQGGEVVGAEFTPEIEAVRLAARWFLEGESYDGIAARLQAGPWAPPAGEVWHRIAAWRLCNNDTYAGLVSWGPWMAESPSDKYPAAWDPDIHRAIIQERKRRQAGLCPHPWGSPLLGVAYCDRCGAKMHLNQQQVKGGELAFYLRCGRHANRARTGQTCHANGIPLQSVLRELDSWIASFATDDAIAEALAESPAHARLEDDLDRMEGTLADLRQQQRRLALAYARGSMSVEVYHDTNTELEGRASRALQQAQELRQQLETFPDPEERLEAARALFQRYSQHLAEVDPQAARRALVAAGVEIRIESSRIRWIGFRL